MRKSNYNVPVFYTIAVQTKLKNFFVRLQFIMQGKRIPKYILTIKIEQTITIIRRKVKKNEKTRKKNFFNCICAYPKFVHSKAKYINK